MEELIRPDRASLSSGSSTDTYVRKASSVCPGQHLYLNLTGGGSHVANVTFH